MKTGSEEMEMARRAGRGMLEGRRCKRYAAILEGREDEMNSYLRKLYAYVEPEGKFATRDRRRECTVQLYECVHIIRRPGRNV